MSMTGNITIDDFCVVCEEFNLEFNALGEDLILRPRNIGFGELFGSMAIYNSQFKTMTVSHGISVIKIQNNRTHKKYFPILNIKVI